MPQSRHDRPLRHLRRPRPRSDRALRRRGRVRPLGAGADRRLPGAATMCWEACFRRSTASGRRSWALPTSLRAPGRPELRRSCWRPAPPSKGRPPRITLAERLGGLRRVHYAPRPRRARRRGARLSGRRHAHHRAPGPPPALARISHQGHGLRGAVGLAGKESRAARCGVSGKRLDAPCQPDSAALRVAPRRPPAASRASSVGIATLFGPLLAERTPGQRRRP